MRCHYHFCYLLLGCFVAACTPIRAVITPTAVTPIATPTAVVTTTLSTPEPVTFVTTDGITLTGTLYGAGTTALILSNMGDNEPAAWDREASLFAEQGYLVLKISG
jgi:hypothetical protein